MHHYKIREKAILKNLFSHAALQIPDYSIFAFFWEGGQVIFLGPTRGGRRIFLGEKRGGEAFFKLENERPDQEFPSSIAWPLITLFIYSTKLIYVSSLAVSEPLLPQNWNS